MQVKYYFSTLAYLFNPNPLYSCSFADLIQLYRTHMCTYFACKPLINLGQSCISSGNALFCLDYVTNSILKKCLCDTRIRYKKWYI